ncbi:Unknown protein [Striga hermonthica]|uniref:Uncharacterized protein n=1 Tax=Striga hermonthica TaxID=68872 RepID=A0A9N7RE05_STRHE|nr:Unknown protein [Striga hermonthica]
MMNNVVEYGPGQQSPKIVEAAIFLSLQFPKYEEALSEEHGPPDAVGRFRASPVISAGGDSGPHRRPVSGGQGGPGVPHILLLRQPFQQQPQERPQIIRLRRRCIPPAGVASRGGSKGDDHPSCFSCNCFRCYMSYWVKWDSSPNRQLIHEIIDSFEESLLKGSKKEKNKRERRKGKNVQVKISAGILAVEPKSPETAAAVPEFNFGESSFAAAGGGPGEIGDGGAGDEDIDEEAEVEEEEEMEKGSVRKLVSFLGERIWSVWG